MSERDRELINGLRRMADEAPSVGLCRQPFDLICSEVERIIEERDALEELYLSASNGASEVGEKWN